MAGPVVAAAVILPKDAVILGINDSKKLSLIKREELFEIINKEALSISIGIIDPQTIDRINILQATFKAMRKAIDGLSIRPDMILVDGNNSITDISIPQKIIKETKKHIYCCSCYCSKGNKDRLMDEFHKFIMIMDLISIRGMVQRNILKQLKNMVYVQFID